MIHRQCALHHARHYGIVILILWDGSLFAHWFTFMRFHFSRRVETVKTDSLNADYLCNSIVAQTAKRIHCSKMQDFNTQCHHNFVFSQFCSRIVLKNYLQAAGWLWHKDLSNELQWQPYMRDRFICEKAENVAQSVSLEMKRRLVFHSTTSGHIVKTNYDFELCPLNVMTT